MLNHFLCETDEIPPESACGFEWGDRELIVANWEGRYHTYLNHCPHLGWALNIQPDDFLDLEKRFLQCSNHMALFEVDSGACVAGPCSGETLTRINCEIRDGKIYTEPPSEK